MSGNLRRLGSYAKFLKGYSTKELSTFYPSTKVHFLSNSLSTQRYFAVSQLYLRNQKSVETPGSDDNRNIINESNETDSKIAENAERQRDEKHEDLGTVLPNQKEKEMNLMGQVEQRTVEKIDKELKEKENSYGWKVGQPKPRLRPFDEAKFAEQTKETSPKVSRWIKRKLVFVKMYDKVEDVPDDVPDSRQKEAQSLLMARVMMWVVFWGYTIFLFLDYLVRIEYIDTEKCRKMTLWMIGRSDPFDEMKTYENRLNRSNRST